MCYRSFLISCMLVPSYCAIAMTEAMAFGGGSQRRRGSDGSTFLLSFLLHDDEDDGREQWVRMYMDEDRRTDGRDEHWLEMMMTTMNDG